jgi:hypothetical protein
MTDLVDAKVGTAMAAARRQFRGVLECWSSALDRRQIGSSPLPSHVRLNRGHDGVSSGKIAHIRNYELAGLRWCNG